MFLEELLGFLSGCFGRFLVLFSRSLKGFPQLAPSSNWTQERLVSSSGGLVSFSGGLVSSGGVFMSSCGGGDVFPCVLLLS